MFLTGHHHALHPIALACAWSLLACSPSSGAASDAQDVIGGHASSDETVVMLDGRTFASGVVVGRGTGTILTAAHAFPRGHTLIDTVVTCRGDRLPIDTVRILSPQDEADLAMVYVSNFIPRSGCKITPRQLVTDPDDPMAARGQRVRVAGFGIREASNWSTGGKRMEGSMTVSNSLLERLVAGAQSLAMFSPRAFVALDSAPSCFAEGDSGGPAFLSDDRVFGIISGKDGYWQAVYLVSNVARAYPAIKNYLDPEHIPPPSSLDTEIAPRPYGATSFECEGACAEDCGDGECAPDDTGSCRCSPPPPPCPDDCVSSGCGDGQVCALDLYNCGTCQQAPASPTDPCEGQCSGDLTCVDGADGWGCMPP